MYRTTLTPTILEKLKTSPWDFGNNILYNMCKDDFNHDKAEHILAKVLFIGRIYAASIERRKTKDENINDNFYFDKVVPTFQNSELDTKLNALKIHAEIKEEIIPGILSNHYYLMKIIREITNLDKRSFCSKYLHFHLPELFFIYDSRAANALKILSKNYCLDNLIQPGTNNSDSKYASFFIKCFSLKSKIEAQFNTKLTNRHFDNILIDLANRHDVSNNKRNT